MHISTGREGLKSLTYNGFIKPKKTVEKTQINVGIDIFFFFFDMNMDRNTN